MRNGSRGSDTGGMITVIRIGILVLVTATLATGCDTGYKFSTSSSNQHPPATQPSAGTSSTPTTSSAPACTAGELSAQGGSKQNPNYIGGAIGDVIISTSARTACQLEGVPSVRLLKRDGSAINVEGAAPVSPVLPPVVLQPRGKSTAELVFTWLNWCASTPGALELQIDLANSAGRLIAPLDGHLGSYVPTCVRPNTPSVLKVEYAYVSAGATKLSTA